MRVKPRWPECGLLMKQQWAIRVANRPEGGLGRSVNGLDSTLWSFGSASEDMAEQER